MITRMVVAFALGSSIAVTPVAAQEKGGTRKPGTWEIAITISGQPNANTGRYCIDASDNLAGMAGGGALQTDCSEASTQIAGEEITIASVCKQGNSTVTMTGLLTGNLESAYKGQITKQYSPPLYGRSEIKSTIDARRLGDCN